MTEEHFIEFVILETNLGSQIHYLKPGEMKQKLVLG